MKVKMKGLEFIGLWQSLLPFNPKMPNFGKISSPLASVSGFKLNHAFIRNEKILRDFIDKNIFIGKDSNSSPKYREYEDEFKKLKLEFAKRNEKGEVIPSNVIDNEKQAAFDVKKLELDAKYSAELKEEEERMQRLTERQEKEYEIELYHLTKAIIEEQEKLSGKPITRDQLGIISIFTIDFDK
jgi:hypothetical protein